MKFRFASFLLMITLASTASAQVQVQMQQVQIQQNVAGPMMGNPVDVEAAMRLEVDTIRRVTGLSEAATKKLEVAAIAAVKNALKKSQELKLPLPGLTDDNAQAQAGSTLSDEDAERADKSAKQNMDQQLAMPVMRTLDVKQVKEESIWTKSFASALNADQIALYEKHLAERVKNRRISAIETKVNELDDLLSLTAAQRKSVTELVDQKLGDILANQPRPAGMMGGGGALIVMMAGQQPAELSPEVLKPILSEVQMAELKRRQDLAAQGPLAALQRVMPPGLQGQVGQPEATPSSLGFSFAEKDQGLEVLSVEDNSEAFKMGLKVGDIVEEVQGMPVDTAIQLKRAMSKRTKGPLMIRVKRGEQVVELLRGETK